MILTLLNSSETPKTQNISILLTNHVHQKKLILSLKAVKTGFRTWFLYESQSHGA